jgi:uncharacterized protein (TIRG00374 family)
LAPAAGAKARSLRWPGAVGLAVSVLLLWWALHDVALLDVLHQARQAQLLPLLGATILATAAFPLRTLRWRYLLRRDGAELPMVPLWHATAIGFMANNLLPARAGELARSYAAGRLTGVRFAAAVGSVAVERLLDGLVLVAMLSAGIVWGGFSENTSIGSVPLARVARVAVLLFVPALGAALWLVHQPTPALRLARWVLGRILPPRWAARLFDGLTGLLAGLDALKSPGRLAVVTGWSVVIWLVSASSYWLGFLAFGMSVPSSAALLLQGVIAFGVAIPSSPGFFGPFEAVTRATLALYGVSAAAAVSYAVVYHIAVFLPISVLGLWSLSRAHLHLAELRAGGAAGAAGAGAGGERL